MKKMMAVALTTAYVAVTAWTLQAQQPAADGPRYQNGDRLLRPADYREWPFLGAGLGLTYDAEPGPGAQGMRPQNFSNVFVNPSSYRHFMQTGTWKDGTGAKDIGGETIVPLRKGDRRVIRFWTFGPGYDGPLTVLPDFVLQEDWQSGAAPDMVAL